MKDLARSKLLHIAESMENGRILNISNELTTVTSMLVQLSQLTNVEESLEHLESARSLCQFDTCEKQVTLPPTTNQGCVDRPAFIIPAETLEFFCANNFKVKDMASMLGVSKRTIERRLADYNIKVRNTYSDISDSELDEMVKRIVQEYPNIGYRTVSSMMMAEGHRVQESRVRNAVRNADPEGVLFRRLFLATCRVQRRTYSVQGPQALWHIDGNQKLIR